MENHYKILGLENTATAKQIRNKYLELVQQYHPDKNPRPEASEKFKKIGESYEILSNSEKKVKYDNSLRNSASSSDLIFSLNTNIPSGHISSGQEIVLNTTYSFKELLNISKLSQSELYEIAEKDPTIALAIFEDKELREKMGSVYLLSLGKKYEAIAIKLVSKNEYHNKFRYQESWIYDLAISHEQACKFIIKNIILAKQLNGQQLFELKKKYPNTFKNLSSSIANIITKKISAYDFLLAYANNTIPIKSYEDINKKLEQAIIDADLLQDQLEKLGKKNLNIATIICNNPHLVKKLGCIYLHSLISAHETLAIKFINNKDLLGFISYPSWVFNLAKTSWKIYQTVLEYDGLLDQLTTEQYTKLKKQYSSNLTNSSITLNNRFKEKIDAYDFLFNYAKNPGSVDLNDDLNKKLKAALNDANLSDEELEDLGKRNLNLATIICDDLNLLKKLGPVHLAYMLCKHESLAIKFVSNSNLWINFKFYNSWTFKLAKKYSSVCQKVLETDELSCHLVGEQLYTLSSKHDFHITELIAKHKSLADKLKAYKLLKNLQTSSASLGKATTSNYSPKVNNGQDDFEIGKSYLTEITLANFHKALPWFKNSAKQGHTATLEYLKELFLISDIKYPAYVSKYALAIAEIYYDVMRDNIKAIKWLFKAVMLESTQALDYLVKYLPEYLESIEYDIYLTDLALLKPFIDIQELSPEQKNDLCHKLGMTFLKEPNTYLAYYFLQHHTDPTADILFELGNLTLQVLAEEQIEEIFLSSKNALPATEVAKKLKAIELCKTRILNALPYFLRAANQGHKEARHVAENLLKESEQFDLTAEQVTEESCTILLQDKALQQYLPETLVKEISQRHSLTYLLDKGRNINVETNQYKKPSFLLPEHIDTAFRELVNCCPITNLVTDKNTFLFYKGLVIEDQQESLLKITFPFDNQDNLLIWILNLALANDEFAKSKLNEWLFQSEFYKSNNFTYLMHAIKHYIMINNVNLETVQQSLGVEVVNRITLSYLYAISVGKNINLKCNKPSLKLLSDLINSAFEHLAENCKIRKLLDYAVVSDFYEGLLFFRQTNNLLQETYPHDNKNNLLVWILNLALEGNEFSKNMLSKWLCRERFHKHKYSNFLSNIIKDYFFQNKYSIDAIKIALGNDIYNKIGIFSFQESKNFASVLQIKAKLPIYYQTIIQSIDNELSDLQNKCFVENIDWHTLNSKCTQWQSTFNELNQITQHYEKVKHNLKPITNYSSILETKTNDPSRSKAKAYYQAQAGAFKTLEDKLNTILNNHYKKDFSNLTIAKPNNQIIYKDIKNAIDDFKAKEGRILFKNEKAWKDVLNKVLTGFAWLLLSPVMLIKTIATHSPVFKPFKSEAEKKLEHLDSSFASNLPSAPNVASNSRDTVAFYNLRNKL